MVPLAAEERRQVDHVTYTFLTLMPLSILPFGRSFPFSLLLESVSPGTESVRQGQLPTTSCLCLKLELVMYTRPVCPFIVARMVFSCHASPWAPSGEEAVAQACRAPAFLW